MHKSHLLQPRNSMVCWKILWTTSLVGYRMHIGCFKDKNMNKPWLNLGYHFFQTNQCFLNFVHPSLDHIAFLGENDQKILIGGLERFLFSIYWEFHHPNWFIFFRGVGIPPTRNCAAQLRNPAMVVPSTEIVHAMGIQWYGSYTLTNSHLVSVDKTMPQTIHKRFPNHRKHMVIWVMTGGWLTIVLPTWV